MVKSVHCLDMEQIYKCRRCNLRKPMPTPRKRVCSECNAIPTLIHRYNKRFFLAVLEGSWDSAFDLLGRGANPNYMDSFRGFTVLQETVLLRNQIAVKRLLEAGADVNIPSENGYRSTALHLVMNNPEFGNLSDHVGIYLRYQREEEIISLLISHGASLEARDGKNDTPLLVAVKNQQLPYVKLLVEAGAGNIEQAREVAVNRGFEEIAEYLEQFIVEIKEPSVN